MKRRLLIVFILAAFLAASIAFAGGQKEEQKGTTATKAPVTLSILTMTGPWISGPVKQHAPDWETKTGNKINLIEAAFSDIFPKVQQAAATRSDAFDMLLVANIWMADMVGWNYVIALD
ncbi:MAG: hypothetical protein AB1798_21555, partial [Spirochaetota bacterium]